MFIVTEYAALTHLSRMEIPITINWTSPFPFVFYFYVYQKSYRTFWKQIVETLIRRHILWHLI